jgi:AAA+ ATPase superfamily predicted ATPase
MAGVSADQDRGLGQEAFRPVTNPYHAGRPLETASPLFVGHKDVFDFIEENISGGLQANVLVLIGQRRTGKTSLLKQLPVRLGARYVSVYIDGQRLGIDPGMANLFYGLSRTIARGMRERDIEVKVPSRAEYEAAPAETFEERFLAEVQGALGERRLVLAFDEFEELEARVREGRLDPTVFPYLRHLIQHNVKLAFVFVGTHKLQELNSEYRVRLFSQALYHDIRFLDEDAARRLIIEPVAGVITYDDLAIESILDATARHPYFLQLTCLSLVKLLNASRRNRVTVQDVRDIVDDVIKLGEANYADIWTNASWEERLMLAALTRLLAERTMVIASDVANELAEHGRQMDPRDVSTTLSGLVAQDIVREIRDHTAHYNFRLDLIRRWIEKYKPLSLVVEEARCADIWAKASREERLVLAALSRLLAERTMVTASDVANGLAKYGWQMDPSDVSTTLSGLVAKEIVREIQDHTVHHNFRRDLFRRWIERFKPFSLAVEEVT